MKNLAQYEKEMLEIGDRLRKLRKSTGLVISEVAGIADLNRNTIGAIERGPYDPRLSTIVKLLDAYDIDLLAGLKILLKQELDRDG